MPETEAAAPVYEIPKECKAAVCYNEGPDFELKVEMVPVPEPGPDEILVKLNATGICYSDIHFLLNDMAPVPMSFFNVRSPGHEGAGIVVKLGSHVKNWKIGDRAGIKPLSDVCYSCDVCHSGKTNYCPDAVHTGLMNTGTYQQYVTTPARYASRIPDGIPDHIAAPIMCSASTMMRALSDSELKPGQWAAFPGGAGGVGIQGVQLAKAMGIRPIVIDAGESKRKLSLGMGAEAFVDFTQVEDVAAEVKKIADGVGVHGVFITATAAYKNAAALIGDRVSARLICIGLPPTENQDIFGVKPYDIVMKDITIRGSLIGRLEDTQRALDFAKRGLLKEVCQIYPIDRIAEAVDAVRNHRIAGRAVIDFNA